MADSESRRHEALLRDLARFCQHWAGQGKRRGAGKFDRRLGCCGPAAGTDAARVPRATATAGTDHRMRLQGR